MRLPRHSQYPKEVLVNGETYRVKFVRRIQNDSTLLGLCCSGTKTIWIKKGQNAMERLKTFVHEVLHAFEFEYDIKIPHKLIRDLEPIIVDYFISNF